MTIELRNITKRFGSYVALDHVNLEIPTGELVALLGPSGCGKTTLLRVIAGMETPDAGEVYFAGSEATHLHVRERQVGFVFQHYALFRHMTVLENVAFGLRVKPRADRPADAEIRKRALDLLKLVQLDWVGDRYPSQLSGGQRQRIALARALAVEPKILLLDEPFGALDTKVRKELRRWLRRLHDEMHISSVFVTHDQEALEVADRIVVLNQGRVEQVGTPDEVYANPATPFVYQFLGNVNVFHSRLHGIWAEVARAADVPHQDSASIAFVRPHDIDIERHPVPQAMVARVCHVHPIGPTVRVEVEHDGDIVEVELTRERSQALALQPGQTVWLRPRQVKVFAAEPSGDVPPRKQPFLF